MNLALFGRGISPLQGLLPTPTQTEKNAHIHASRWLEPAIRVLERVKTFRVLDRRDTEIGVYSLDAESAWLIKPQNIVDIRSHVLCL